MAKDISQIGDELRRQRESVGMTQAELAMTIGVDSQTVSRWERGERTPNAADYQRAREAIAEWSRQDGRVRGAGPSPSVEVADAIKRFLREATRTPGSTDADIDYLEAMLWGRGPAELLAASADPLRELDHLFAGLRTWLARRIQDRHPRPPDGLTGRELVEWQRAHPEPDATIVPSRAPARSPAEPAKPASPAPRRASGGRKGK